MRRLTRPRKLRNAIKRRLVGDAIEGDNPDAPDASEFFTTDKPAEQVASEIAHSCEPKDVSPRAASHDPSV